MPTTMTTTSNNELTSHLRALRVEGYRSLKDVELRDLPEAALLIGPNGAGKSNCLHLLRLLRCIVKDRRLNLHAAFQGGADQLLHVGHDQTPAMMVEVKIDNQEAQVRDQYRLGLGWQPPENLQVNVEKYRTARLDADPRGYGVWHELAAGGKESTLLEAARAQTYDAGKPKAGKPKADQPEQGAAQRLVDYLEQVELYEFNTSLATYAPGVSQGSPALHLPQEVGRNFRLEPDGANLAPVLLRLKETQSRRLELIEHQVQRCVPEFEHFVLEPDYGKVLLQWQGKQRRNFQPHLTSAATLKLMALFTLLNLPTEELPALLLLDNPDLGLHPAAIDLLAGMLRSLRVQKQIITATQSPRMVDSFEPEEVYVLEDRGNGTKVRRNTREELNNWLEEYSLGELWEKNVLGGRP